MKVKKFIETDTEQFDVGDIIEFTLNDGEEVQALAVDKTDDWTVFMTVDCLKTEYKMFNIVDGMNEKDIAYMNSDLRKALNREILDRFPEEIKSRMVAVNSDGDLLRIPTEKETFGGNFLGEKEPDSVKQWEPMKYKRNRITLQGNNGELEWYWLMNKCKKSAPYFARVLHNGYVDYNGAGGSSGVRPVFKLKIKNHAPSWGE